MSINEFSEVRKLEESFKINVLTSGGFKRRTAWLLRILEKYFIILAIITTWELMPRLELIDSFLLPPFSEVVVNWVELITSGEMFKHFSISIARVLCGFFIGIGIAFPLGIFMGWYKGFEEIVDPLLQACRSSSTIALYPIFLLFFGIGEQAKIAIIVWGTIWPTMLSAVSGVKNADPLLIKSARSMGVTGLTLLTKVIIPNAVPNVVAGIRLSAAHSLLVVVVAEMIGAHAGLGYSIFYLEEHYAVPEMYAMIVTLSLTGVTVNYLLNLLEKRLTMWKEKVVTD
ncbi:MAG: ABC transporter permease [Pelosinus sp.]|nr:ABC transporter permease [Pelosinus sp.]